MQRRRRNAVPSPLVHFQIATPDPEATRAFFRELFDWEFTPGAGRIVANVDTGARRIEPNDIYPGGSLLQTREGASTYAALFFRVADLDATVRRAQKLGARVLVPRSRTLQGTDVSIIATPEGLTIGIVQL
jgi:predicted enzyme related to lactoylglutathione lyase